MDELVNRIEQKLSSALKQIAAAAEKGDLVKVGQLTKDASELSAMKSQIQAIENRLRNLENGSQVSDVLLRTSAGRREFVIEATQGAIGQNYLRLTEHKKRGLIRARERLNIEALPSGDRFETELLENGSLQERGKIAKFYRDAGVNVGDLVVLGEVTPGRWQLKKKI